MKEELVGILMEKIIEAGVSVLTKIHHGSVKRNRLNELLREFMERKKKVFERSSLDEEIDFQGLFNYMERDFPDDALEYLYFKGDSKKRKKKRDYIASKAIEFSKARTGASKKTVSHLVFDAVDLIGEFEKRKIKKRDWLLINEMSREIQTGVNELRNTICDIAQPSIPQSFLKLVESGRDDLIDENIRKIQDVISLKHPLYPDYGFRYSGNDRISVPLNKDAVLKNPPLFVFKGELRVGDTVIDELEDSTLVLADRHQLNVTLTIQEAKKYLGEIEDPVQHEAEALVGHVLIRKPKPFPPAFPCKIIIDGITYIEYTQLRTEEVLDDGSFVVSNKEDENNSFQISIRIHIGNENGPNKVSYSMSIKDADNQSQLIYAKMMYHASKGGIIEVYMYEKKQNLIEGSLDPFEYKGGFETAEAEIDFLERVVEIEEHYGVRINMGMTIGHDDYSSVIDLSNLLRGGIIRDTWDEFSVEFEYSNDTKETILELEDKEFRLMFSGIADISVFDQTFAVKICNVFRKARIKDIDRLKLKMECSDEGDRIKIHYIASGDNTLLLKFDSDDLDRKTFFMDEVKDDPA